MKFKEGVKIIGIRPELMIALIVADGIWLALGPELVVTSVNDSKHSYGSLHFMGAAADLRIWDINPDEAAKRLRMALTDEFDVVVESDHIHVEFQPKTAR